MYFILCDIYKVSVLSCCNFNIFFVAVTSANENTQIKLSGVKTRHPAVMSATYKRLPKKIFVRNEKILKPTSQIYFLRASNNGATIMAKN